MTHARTAPAFAIPYPTTNVAWQRKHKSKIYSTTVAPRERERGWERGTTSQKTRVLRCFSLMTSLASNAPPFCLFLNIFFILSMRTPCIRYVVRRYIHWRVSSPRPVCCSYPSAHSATRCHSGGIPTFPIGYISSLFGPLSLFRFSLLQGGKFAANGSYPSRRYVLWIAESGGGSTSVPPARRIRSRAPRIFAQQDLASWHRITFCVVYIMVVGIGVPPIGMSPHLPDHAMENHNSCPSGNLVAGEFPLLLFLLTRNNVNLMLLLHIVSAPVATCDVIIH